MIAEKEHGFLQAVRELARWNHWLTYHTLRSTGSEPGFPDLVLARYGSPIIFAELKTPLGRLTKSQALWLDAIGGAQGVRAKLWRPGDWDEIERLIVHGMS